MLRKYYPLFITACLLGLPLIAQSPTTGDSCIDCHKSEDFLVTDKKLYDYFQDWRASIHGQEDIVCVDCHGGNAKAADKETAHGTRMSPDAKSRAVDFQNIPDTCGTCHDDQLQAYVKSNHYQHLTKTEAEGRGPNCVTCHGSLNSRKLDVNTVADVCQQCHNEETKNTPEIPNRAMTLLNDFNTISGYRRFIERRDPVDSKLFLGNLDRNMSELSTTWHLFDIEKIEANTSQLLQEVKTRRKAVLKKPKSK